MARVEQLADHVEQAVDGASLHDVLEALVLVCHAKAEHLESNWGDADAARAWTRAAGYIEKAASRVQGLGV
jgi:hypothetical protein